MLSISSLLVPPGRVVEQVTKLNNNLLVYILTKQFTRKGILELHVFSSVTSKRLASPL